jgi:hypothetical protein
MRRGAGAPPAVRGASRPQNRLRAGPLLSGARECPRRSGRETRYGRRAMFPGLAD